MFGRTRRVGGTRRFVLVLFGAELCDLHTFPHVSLPALQSSCLRATRHGERHHTQVTPGFMSILKKGLCQHGASATTARSHTLFWKAAFCDLHTSPSCLPYVSLPALKTSCLRATRHGERHHTQATQVTPGYAHSSDQPRAAEHRIRTSGTGGPTAAATQRPPPHAASSRSAPHGRRSPPPRSPPCACLDRRARASASPPRSRPPLPPP